MLYFVLINRIISPDWLNIFVLLYISLMTYNILNCFNVVNYSAFSSFTHIYTTIYTLNCILTQDEEALLSYFISLICIYFLFSGNFILFFLNYIFAYILPRYTIYYYHFLLNVIAFPAISTICNMFDFILKWWKKNNKQNKIKLSYSTYI